LNSNSRIHWVIFIASNLVCHGFGVGFPCKENLSQFEAKPVEHGRLENFRNREPGRVIFHDSTAV
jgi:hypothetical protein